MSTVPAPTRSRAHRLRTRAFDLGVMVKELAERTGYHRVHLSRILNERETSRPALDAVEQELDRIESERKTKTPASARTDRG